MRVLSRAAPAFLVLGVALAGCGNGGDSKSSDAAAPAPEQDAVGQSSVTIQVPGMT